MNFAPKDGEKAIHAVAKSPYLLDVTLENSTLFHLDLNALIERRDAYWRLKQFRYFAQVKVDKQGRIYWPEGEDLAPDGLNRYVVN